MSSQESHIHEKLMLLENLVRTLQQQNTTLQQQLVTLQNRVRVLEGTRV